MVLIQLCDHQQPPGSVRKFKCVVSVSVKVRIIQQIRLHLNIKYHVIYFKDHGGVNYRFKRWRSPMEGATRIQDEQDGTKSRCTQSM